MRRLLSGFGVAFILAGLTAITVFAGPDKPKLGRSQPTFDPQSVTCTGVAATMPDPNIDPIGACTGNVFTLGAAAEAKTAIQVLKGNALTLVNGYTAPGFRVCKDGGAGCPTDGTVVGGLQAQIDLLCDGVTDTFGNNTAEASGDDEQFYKVTAAWGAGTETTYAPTVGNNYGPSGVGAGSGAYLDKLLPPATVFGRLNRARADVTTIYIGSTTVGGGTPLPLTNPTPINAVFLHPTWADGGATSGTTAAVHAGTTLSFTLLGGAPTPPSNQKLCLQAPQNSRSRFAALGASGMTGNPLACNGTTITTHCGDGIYIRWAVFLSAADLTNNAQTVIIDQQNDVYGTLAAGYDDDGDGLGDSGSGCVSPARPCESTADDAGGAVVCAAGSIMGLATTADRDCDGLSDGIEVAWGSLPGTADSDGDGRDDSEEMTGPGAFLTNPLSTDTDGDGVTDGGLVSINGSGVSALTTGGRYTTISIPGDPVSSPQSVFAGDNCPNIANAAQTNTGAGRLGYAIGDPGTLGGWATGLPATRPDRTNANASLTGDACNNDIDDDQANDGAEASMQVGSVPGGACNTPNPTAADTANYAAGTTGLVSEGGTVADTDGDRTRDGSECLRGTNPRDNDCGQAVGPSPACVGQGAGTDATAGNIDTGSTGNVAVGSTLAFNEGALPPTSDFAGFYRVVNIGRDPAGYVCGTGRICNLLDFANATNPCGASCGSDSDGDAVKDAHEAFCHGTSPGNVDSDRDGLSDAAEVYSIDTDAKVAFSDLLKFAGKFNSIGYKLGTSGARPTPTWDPNADWDCNGEIAFADLLLFAGVFNLNDAPVASSGTPAQLAP